MKKCFLITIIALLLANIVGCASTMDYRSNPTYNYPSRGYNKGTTAEAKNQREWAHTERVFAQAESQRADAAMKWQRVQTEAAMCGVRTTQGYARAASDIARAVGDFKRVLHHR